MAHELAHNLGSYHDGDKNNNQASLCKSNDNFIMSPSSGSNANNLQNYFKFSNCSIEQFKSTLLDLNG